MILLRGLNRFLVELAAFGLSLWHHLLSPLFGCLFGCRCRFYPSCSQYAAEALRERGFLPGLVLASRRIVRCNALSPGGYDPVLKRWGERS